MQGNLFALSAAGAALSLIAPFSEIALAQPCAPQFVTRLYPDPGMGGEGQYFAINGDRAVVSSVGGVALAGFVTVFHRTNGIWAQEATLVGSDATEDSNYGTGISISGDTVAVGAPRQNNLTGAVYVFTRNGTTWSEQTKIPGPFQFSSFGVGLAIDGDTLAVGSSTENAVYVYRRTGAEWNLQARLSGDQNGQQFGRDLALEGDTLVCGAPGQLAIHGSAFVFTRSGNTWTRQAKLMASDSAPQTIFGDPCSLSGDTIVIGALRAGGSGAAYVFTRDNGIWTERQRLAEVVTGNDNFGISTAVSGDIIAVGSYITPLTSGTAYFYHRQPSGSWALEPLNGSSVGNVYSFGISVALDGSTAMVGAIPNFGGLGGGFIFGITRPNILKHPQDVAIDSGGEAAFTVHAVSSSALSYQWQRDGIPLTESAPYSGTNSPTLHINPATSGDNGRAFNCIVTTSCGSTTSQTALLSVQSSCPADINGDGLVDDSDFVLFASAYNTLDCADPSMPPGCPSDLTGDAVVDDSDFVLFAAAYNELICP